MVDLSKLKSPVNWAETRKEIETEVMACLGKIPKGRVDLQIKTVDEREYRGYVRRRINYFVDSWNRVSAWLFIPEGKEEMPALLCCHQKTPFGKDESAGLEGDHRLAFAQHYAEAGYVTLAPDCITAGDRVSAKSAPYDGKAFYKEYPKASMAGKMLADHRAAIDVLSEFKRVDSARIGVIGHGLGAFNALLLTAFDERVQACVASCGFTRFETDKAPLHWIEDDGFSLFPTMLKEQLDNKQMPFDFEHLIALGAPSATFIVTTLSESNFTNPKSCQKAVTQAKKIYQLLGAPGAVDHYTHHDGPCVTPDTLDLADEWFERWL